MVKGTVHRPTDAPPPENRSAARSRSREAALRVAWVANTVCAAVYLGWLACGGRESLFYDRDGVLMLLPVIPILAVFLFLLRQGAVGKRGRGHGPDEHRNDLRAWLRRPPRRR